jgi:hypothetical protein
MDASPAAPKRAVFRMPFSALVIPLLAFVCFTPLAFAGGAWIWIYAVPVLVLVWVLITRTVADRASLRATGPRGRRTIRWDDLATIEFRGQRWAVAVDAAGRRTTLPNVRPRDVPRLVAAAGGTLNLAGPSVPEPEAEIPAASGSTLVEPDVVGAEEPAPAVPEDQPPAG